MHHVLAQCEQPPRESTVELCQCLFLHGRGAGIDDVGDGFGLQQIETQIRQLEQEREQAKQADDKPLLARVDRDLRYWLQRKASARRVDPESPPVKVRFGMRVTLRYPDDKQRKFVLVGEDEADPAAGLISWASPVGQKLLGNEIGEEIDLQGQRVEIVDLDIPSH